MASSSAPKVLAIIPARAGSKGVPGKNKRMLDGLPLVAYAIITGLQCQGITHLMINTDDEEVANIGRSYGVDVKMRDPKLAQDNSPVHLTILESIQYAEANTGIDFDMVMLLQPTSPLRTSQDADAIINMLHSNEHIDGVVSMVKVEDAHPGRMYTMDAASHLLTPLYTEGEYANRQELQPVYLRNGCFYCARKQAILRDGTIIVHRKAAYVMDEKWELNIDTERDFRLGELIIKDWKQAVGWHA